MVSSPLTTRWVGAASGNFTVGRGGAKVGGIVIHHAATTNINVCDTVFNNPSYQTSAHYAVNETEIRQYVGEEDTAYHCGNWWGNQRTIGIETINSTTGDWLVSDGTFNNLVRLVADLAKRYGLGKLYLNPSQDLPVLSGHRDWVATACPGDYLYSKLQELCDRANEINYPSKPTLSWSKFEKVKKYKTKLQPTNLWNVNTTNASAVKSVKQYNQGEEIEIYGKFHHKEFNFDYLVTQYSYEKGLANGFNVVDMAEVVEKPPIVWVDLPKTLGLFTKSNARLIDLDTGKVVQVYSANTKIDLAQQAEVNGELWYRTRYSYEKGLNNAFKDDMFEFPVTQDDPSEPSTDQNVDMISEHSDVPQNKNDQTDDNSNDGSSDSSDKNFVVTTLTVIIEFIKKIINLILRKGEE